MTHTLGQITFHGVGEFRGVTLTTFADRSFAPWFQLRDAMAGAFDLYEDDLVTFEAYFGGEYGDEDRAELVTYDGRLIGALDRLLTDAEFALISSIPHFANINKTTDAERATPTVQLAAE